MPEIELTEEQYEYLQALREDIQTQVVGKYATVRTVDAVQYLIDNHEGEINATVTEPSDGPGSSEVEPAADPGSGDDGDSDGDAAAVDADDGESEEAAGEADGGTPAAPMAAAGGGGDDDGMLSAMMALMDTHDDKWEEASGDTGYEVELPDGSTEAANTQDDVRALLFKHYE